MCICEAHCNLGFERFYRNEVSFHVVLYVNAYCYYESRTAVCVVVSYEHSHIVISVLATFREFTSLLSELLRFVCRGGERVLRA